MSVEDIARRLYEETSLAKIIPPYLKSDKWRRAIANWAKMYGYEKIGQGYFGAVFLNKNRPNEVVKVFSDTSYLEWIKLAKQNSSNPYMPRFKGTPVRLYKGKDLWMIRMEKLKSLESNYDNSLLVIDTRKFCEKYLFDNYGVKGKTLGHYVVPIDLKSKEYKKIWENADLLEAIDAFGMFLTYEDMQEKYVLDLHQGNFMLRGSQLVFTDPFALRVNRPTN